MGRRGLGGGEGQGKTKEGVRRVAPAQGRSDLSPSGICSASEAGGRPGAPAPSPFLSLSPRPIQRSPRWRPWGLIGRPGADRGINWSSGRLRGPLAAHSPAASPSRRSCWVSTACACAALPALSPSSETRSTRGGACVCHRVRAQQSPGSLRRQMQRRVAGESRRAPSRSELPCQA